MKIDLHYGMDPPFGPTTHEAVGVGGTENFITYSAEYLARARHDVRVYNKIVQTAQWSDLVTWHWYPLSYFDPAVSRDVLMSFRTPGIFEQPVNARLKVLTLADTESYGLGDMVRVGKVDLVIYVSQWQADKIGAEEGIPDDKALVSSNGVAMARLDELRDQVERVPGKCIHLATPERGLEPLLAMWPAIQERVPHAELHLFSSFKGWRVNEADNANMCRDVYDYIAELQANGARIVNHEHANAPTVRRHLLESQLYLYPTRHFNETCCISALEASAAGVPIIATGRAALLERVRHCHTGYLVDEGPNHDRDFIGYVTRTLENENVWRQLSATSIAMARRYDYARLVQDWTDRFEEMLA